MKLKLRAAGIALTILFGAMPQWFARADGSASANINFGGHFDQSHSMWTQVLQKSAKKAGHASTVNYREIKKDPSNLNAYLEALESVSQEEFSHFSNDEKLAFLVNAYNAFTVKLIVDHYPVKSIKDIGSLFSSPWKKEFFQLLGAKRSLDNIEHEMIRKQFNEPRVHFALNCASVGCPALRTEAYTAVRIESQLEEATRDFLADKQRNCFHPTEKKLEVSPIFKWYGDDFVKKYGSLEEFFATRIVSNPESQKQIRAKTISISFVSYDWSLNESK